MCWKKMPYWLKGGIIGAIIALIYDIRGLILYGIRDLGLWFFSLTLDLLIIFIIGALIGLIIGIIIKRRKKKISFKKRIKKKEDRKKKKK